SRSKANSDWSSLEDCFRWRARYDASRSESSLRQAVSPDPRALPRIARYSPGEPSTVGSTDSQKLQVRALDGSTAPHCKHVFVTGAFCAADACTPARSDLEQNTTQLERVETDFQCIVVNQISRKKSKR